MKTRYILIGGLFSAAAMFTGCRDERMLDDGQGRMMLTTSVMNDIKVVSRALSAEEIADMSSKATIWISDSQKGRLYSFEGLASFPAEGLPLETGSYVAEAWVGDSVPASWDSKRFKGTEPFEITRGVNTQVDLVCHIRNTVVSVNLDPDIEGLLSDIKLTVALDDGVTDGSHSLIFKGDNIESLKGYYMINSRTKGLLWTFEGVVTDTGAEFKKEGKFTDPSLDEAPFLSHATEYKFNVKFDTAGDIQIGGAYFTIEVEAEPVEGEVKEVLIAIAPDIKGVGFPIDEPLVAEPGAVGRRSLYVTGSCELKNVVISGSLLNAVDANQNFYDLLTMTDIIRERLLERGFDFQTYNRSEANPDQVTNVRINLEESLLNSLAEGVYELTVSATDALDQTTEKIFTLEVSLAPVQANSVPESAISYTGVTLTGKLLDASAVNPGFEVKAVADGRAYDDWTFVAGQVTGTTFTAAVTGLKQNAEYEYRVVATTAAGERYEGRTAKFKTLAYPQLPNADFEEWSGSAPMLIYDTNPMFWDSGNHGSKTMGKDVTTKDSSVKHSGSYSACLHSQFLGVGSLGKFAAGNAFVGKYLKTDGTDGELGWGRPWDPQCRPKALKLWAKYTPGTVDKNVYKKTTAPDDVKAEFPEGAQDKGIIYVALVTMPAEPYSDYPDWPVVVKTKSQQLFDKTADKVKAYGEHIFAEATQGSDMVEITIPINEVNPGDFSHIMIVCSASKAGDYFLGGEGSKLWIDDLELVY